MKFEDAKVAEFRGEVLKVLLVVSMCVSAARCISFVPAFHWIGIDILTLACGVYFVVMSIVHVQFHEGRWQQSTCARFCLGATLALMLLGLYTGSELVDNKPWQMLFPIVAFVLAGSREGVFWCVAALAGAVTILFLRGSEYAALSIFIFAIAHMTTSYVVYVFMMRNEANIRTISHLSHTDSLTNTYNRQLFNELSISELNRARRTEEPLAFYMIDIDHFKKYNDRYGHLAGDRALRNVADVIRRSARRASDLVFRYGGEEFCVVSSGMSIQEARFMANNIIEGVRALGLKHEEGENGQLTVSIGLSYHQELDDCSTELLLERADNALYMAKSDGRDRLVLYSPAQHHQLDLLKAIT